MTYTDARTIADTCDTSRPRDHPDGGHSRDSLTDDERELRPASQYEWTQIVRRARLGELIKPSKRRGKDGRPTKGGMSGLAVTGIALGFASFASPDGGDVWPGDAMVAVSLETSMQAIETVRKAMIQLGMMELVAARRGRRGDEYRLTLPSDLLDRVEVLTPAQLDLAAARLRDKARGRDRRRVGPPDPPERSDPAPSPARVGPADPPENADIGDRVGPADPPEICPDSDVRGPADPPENGLGGSGGTTWGGPADPLTRQDQTTNNTSHSDGDLCTDVTGPRAPDVANEDQDSDGELRASGTASPAADPEHCPDHPAMRGGVDERGRLRCPLCRRLVVPRDVPVWLQEPPAPQRPASPALAPAVNGATPASPRRRAALTLIRGGG